LTVEVEDDGVGFSGEGPREGVGLGNTRARLTALYGDRQRVDLRKAAGGGVLVTLEIPFQTAATP